MEPIGKERSTEAAAREFKRNLWIIIISIAGSLVVLAALAGYYGTAGSWFGRVGIVLLVLGSLSAFFLGFTILGSHLGHRLRKGSRIVMALGGVIGMLSGLALWFFIVFRPLVIYVL